MVSPLRFSGIGLISFNDPGVSCQEKHRLCNQVAEHLVQNGQAKRATYVYLHQTAAHVIQTLHSLGRQFKGRFVEHLKGLQSKDLDGEHDCFLLLTDDDNGADVTHAREHYDEADPGTIYDLYGRYIWPRMKVLDQAGQLLMLAIGKPPPPTPKPASPASSSSRWDRLKFWRWFTAL
ncbi:MAG: hypothetical protein R2857_12015 [Vampirovibrionales bacterium]